jgi:hypothetical protein
MFRSVIDHPQGDIYFLYNKYNRHASTNPKILSLLTDVKKINISLKMFKN